MGLGTAVAVGGTAVGGAEVGGTAVGTGVWSQALRNNNITNTAAKIRVIFIIIQSTKPGVGAGQAGGL